MPVTAAITTAVVGGSVYQVDRSQKAAREQKRASADRKRAGAISQASQENERQAALRKQVREERVRRAQILSSAEGAGVGGSSAATSTIGSGQTLAQAGQAFASGATLASGFQSAFLQSAADANTRANFDLAQGQIGGAVSSLALASMSAFDIGGAGGEGSGE